MNCLACKQRLEFDSGIDFQRANLLEIIAICGACGCGNTIAERMGLEATPDFRRFGTFVEACLLVFRVGRALKIAPIGFFGEKKAILDYGCGRGEFLSLMRKFKWKIQGTEYSLQSAKEAFAKSIPIRTYEQHDDEPIKFFEDNSFDFVTSFHNLEHLDSPRIFLNDAYKKIKVGGKLIIEVPNFGSVQAKMVRQNWVLLDPGNHRIHFTREGLEIALNDSKFKILSIGTLSIQYGVFGMVEALRLRLFGNSQTSIFNQLQRDSSQKEPKTYRVFIQAAILLIPGVLFEVASVFRGRGAVLRVVCRKL
jgi:2-polyprenyl-3-methyl-5-hydroxy-6-metoxy-1,4-benzoquinol methylase